MSLRPQRRASTLLWMAIPLDQREELISAKRLTAMKIVCHLMVLYEPGGFAEKELVLLQLENPPEAVNLSDALQGLRKWSRWRHRATDRGVQEPDPFLLLLKGLKKLTRKALEQHRDPSFRISLARSTLQVDATPTSRTITSFLLHLIAEFEQVAPSEATHPKKKDIPEPKVKMAKPDFGGPKDKSSGGDQGDQKQASCKSPKNHEDLIECLQVCSYVISWHQRAKNMAMAALCMVAGDAHGAELVYWSVQTLASKKQHCIEELTFNGPSAVRSCVYILLPSPQCLCCLYHHTSPMHTHTRFLKQESMKHVWMKDENMLHGVFHFISALFSNAPLGNLNEMPLYLRRLSRDAAAKMPQYIESQHYSLIVVENGSHLHF